jgi:uncharacterized protein (TIGR02246 family)
MSDEQAIRDLIQNWIAASAAGNLDQVLALMSDDVLFHTMGREPFGKEAFAAASRGSVGKVRPEGIADIRVIQVAATWPTAGSISRSRSVRRRAW